MKYISCTAEGIEVVRGHDRIAQLTKSSAVYASIYLDGSSE